jgi:hypothetical protein
MLKIFLVFFLVKESLEVSFECEYENFYAGEHVGIIYYCNARNSFWYLDEPQINSINELI